jgi:DNA-binding MarR family transcriptional regulator
MRPSEEAYADLADLVLTIGRELRGRAYDDPQIVRLSSTEVNVMRFVDQHPGASPSAVAVGTGLRRSNLSKALRSLEARGLVERSVDDADNRHAVLRPTPLAAENLARLRRSWSRLLSAGLTDGGAAPDLPAALNVLRAIETGLAVSRPSG